MFRGKSIWSFFIDWLAGEDSEDVVLHGIHVQGHDSRMMYKDARRMGLYIHVAEILICMTDKT